MISFPKGLSHRGPERVWALADCRVQAFRDWRDWGFLHQGASEKANESPLMGPR